MDRISVADAKARLSALIDRAAAGETVCITRRGKPVARLVPIEAPREPFDFEALRLHAESMPRQAESAGEFMRGLRNADRF